MPAGVVATESQYTAEEDRDVLRRVVVDGEDFENGIGVEFRDRCNRFYNQYRQFSRFKSDWIAEPRDRDSRLIDAKRNWGSNLSIPLSFRTIETVVPAAIAQRPRMLYLPRRQKWAENVANVRVLIDAQQDQIDIDLPFQAVMRSGRIYGIGVGKTLWRKEYAQRRRATKRLFRPGYHANVLSSECIFDDPDFEDVDVFDFMWDQYGSSPDTCGYIIHRGWRSLNYCVGAIESGRWNTASVQQLKREGTVEDAIRGMGGRNRYDEVWQSRMQASGFSSTNWTSRGEQIHEVWEWHDGHQVHTVLDRCLLVVKGENPVVGMKPFMVYRPTPLQKQMVGIGDLEPLEHLQRMVDTLASQAVDANTLALAMGFAYDSAAVDEEDLVFAPNKAIEVRNARPSEAIYPLPKPEIPAASFRLMEMARSDIDAVGGVTEALSPQQGGASSTATEAFLQQAALSRRVQLGSRRFEIEVVRRAAKAFLFLNQRMILDNREMLLPPEGMTVEQAAECGQWRKFDVGPGGLMGDFMIRPEGGSMAARNIPQDRQDAQAFFALAAGNPHVDGRRASLRALELMGVDDPEGWLKQSAPPLPPAILEILDKELGVDPRLIQQAVAAAQQRDPQLPPEERAQRRADEPGDGRARGAGSLIDAQRVISPPTSDEVQEISDKRWAIRSRLPRRPHPPCSPPRHRSEPGDAAQSRMLA
jgi:hypothetical protein